MMTRKIIQIAVAMIPIDEDSSYGMTVVLCNDHTVWHFKGFDMEIPWQQLPPIPQKNQEISMSNLK